LKLSGHYLNLMFIFFQNRMIVSPTEPFKVVFSLFSHEYLGYLIEGYVAKLNAKGEVSYQTQNISVANMKDFEEKMSDEEKRLIKLTDEIQQDVILKKYNTKKWGAGEFFTRVFDPEKGDKQLQELIFSYIENRRKEIYSLIRDKPFFIMGNDGIPTWKEVEIVQEPAKSYFHFERLEDHTVYYPILKCKDEKLKFQFKNAVIINDVPAALLLENKLYIFDQYTDGKKIKPFLNKPNIIIPRKIEETYFAKFLVPLIASFNVFAKGFDIVQEKEQPKAILRLKTHKSMVQPSLFEDLNSESADAGLSLSLAFKYGNFEFPYTTFNAPAYVEFQKKEDSYVFFKVKKDQLFEKNILNWLLENDLNIRYGTLNGPKSEILAWILENHLKLSEKGIEVIQEDQQNQSQYFIGYANIEVNIIEKTDWFDVEAVVRFGDFEISFKILKKYILNNIKEFTLPNGQIAIIPEAWFLKYSDLFDQLQDQEDQKFKLPLHMAGIVNHLHTEGLATTVLNRRIEALLDFEKIEEAPLPQHFKADLRPYQKAAYDWLVFLRTQKLGACLADDMGLGKTVTTLAFLQKIHEGGTPHPSLILMPTSLIYNWQKEATRFTPKLKILVHFGPHRHKNLDIFLKYDLIISSYGVLRSDIDLFKSFLFEQVVLDESQNIKNPSSHIFSAVMQLQAKNRMILTGTPLENSSLDLWSQMSFVNPGLLGSESEFRKKFMLLIDKKRDEDLLKKLHLRVKPFMLRRHKKQVAKELPEKVETISYSSMSEDQEKLYEETKSVVRNAILKSSQNSNMLILQGLSKLRQIANHPQMVQDDYNGDSGKLKDVMHKLLETVEQGSKTLVFSQFVKHLTLVKEELDSRGIPYLYLDGSTKNRIELVDEFQSENSPLVFLISLKAGGVGLNLTAAEYVFLLDPWWNPAIEAQAIDRAHRIGQTRTVFIYKFISQNSIEEKILDLQNSKKQLFDDLVTEEEGFVKKLNKEDMMALLN
jgi:SNF2 family DNA or RNA helicase